MKSILNSLLFFILFCSSCNGQSISDTSKSKKEFVYWENLSNNEKEIILELSDINKNAIKLYEGNFTPADNEVTFNLLSELTSKNQQEQLSFYFYLFNKIVLQADGALSEAMGKYVYRIIIHYPEYVFNYFTLNEEEKTKEQPLYVIYASFLGYELHFKDEGLSDLQYNYKEFRQKIDEKLSNSSEKTKKTARVFWEEIERVMAEMN